MSAQLEVHMFPCLSDNYGFLIHDPVENLTASIDTPDVTAIEDELKQKNWRLTHIINTHHHYDHAGGNLELKKKTDCTIIGPIQDLERIPGIDLPIEHGQEFNFGSFVVKGFHTPGHTLGHVCFYMPDEKCLFSGDTLFYLGCGRVFEGTMDQMWSSLAKLKSLPEDTSVYCGHEYTLSNMKFANYIDTNNALLNKISLEIKNKREKGLPTVPFNLGVEKKINPFLRVDDDNFIKSVGIRSNNVSESFGKIRLKKDNF